VPDQRCGKGLAWIRRIGIRAGRERALGGIKFVNQNAVQAEIRDVNEPIVRGWLDPVRVRCLLPFLIWPDGAGILCDRSVFAKLTVR